MKDPRIVKAIAALCEAFNRQPTPATFGAYEIGLAGLTADEVERAAALALRQCKFMPVPAELRELASGDGAGFESMADKAFYTLKQAMQRLGPDCSVNFQDGAINAAVRLLGGWIRVNEIPVGDELDKWFRRDFIAAYVRLCKTGCSEDLRRYHGGLLERDNSPLDGKEMSGGWTYRLGMYGSDVQSVGADYTPALPAPERKRQLTADSDRPRVELKRIESK